MSTFIRHFAIAKRTSNNDVYYNILVLMKYFLFTWHIPPVFDFEMNTICKKKYKNNFLFHTIP